MPVNLVSAGGGTTTLTPASSASNFTVTVPSATTTMVGTDAVQTLTNKTIQGGAITSGTVQATTSGTSVTFTGIPSWVKRVTVNFVGVSQSGTTQMEVRVGTSGGVVATGYSSGASSGLNAIGSTSSTTGFRIRNSVATDDINGSMVISNQTGNTWVCTYSMTGTNGAFYIGGGSIALASALTQIQIAPNSADTFDAGSINILYE